MTAQKIAITMNVQQQLAIPDVLTSSPLPLAQALLGMTLLPACLISCFCSTSLIYLLAQVTQNGSPDPHTASNSTKEGVS